MKVTVFTSNQPRHISLVNSLAEIADTVYAVQECTTVLPGIVKDRYDNSDCMKKYFSRMREAERMVFGNIGFFSENVKSLSIKSGDLSQIPLDMLDDCLESDYYIVFGASYIKGDLIRFLVKHKAVNIHMGVSPFYRGSACNFWAIYDGNPELVGATIHLLSEKLDAGDILFHALPKPQNVDPFVLGMQAVKVAHDSIVERIRKGELLQFVPEVQDRTKEIRYSRNSEFNDEVAEEYMKSLITGEEINRKLQGRDEGIFINCYLG